MKSKKDTSPVRSRDKVIQSLYEIELSGSDINELLKDRINLKDFKEISVTDLIERKVNVNFNKLRHHFRNKKIIITGAGGSIGSELCIQLIKLSLIHI